MCNLWPAVQLEEKRTNTLGLQSNASFRISNTDLCPRILHLSLDPYSNDLLGKYLDYGNSGNVIISFLDRKWG